jgi:hypothetical protein
MAGGWELATWLWRLRFASYVSGAAPFSRWRTPRLPDRYHQTPHTKAVHRVDVCFPGNRLLQQ